MTTGISYAGWQTWPDVERASVQAIFAEAWRYGLKQHPDDYSPESWLTGIALINGDVRAALDAWITSPAPNATLQLAEFFGGEAEQLFSDKFWQGASDATIETMRRWLLSEPVVDRLLSASGAVGPEDEWRIDRALLILDTLSPARPR